MEHAQNKMKALKARMDCAPVLMSEAMKEQQKLSKKKIPIFCIKHKGAFTSQSHMFAQILAQAGCSAKHVGSIMEQVVDLMGITVDSTMSR